MRALVTGFEPFGGDGINASIEAVRRLPARIGAIEIHTAELPTSFARSLPALEGQIERVRPAIVLCVGQASERQALCVERVAINVQDARLADNDGASPIDVPVMSSGPAAYLATLPIKAIVRALIAARLPAEVSNTAGLFVCNHVLYGVMHLTATTHRKLRAGLLHVPSLKAPTPEDSKGAPGLSLDELVRAIRITLEVTAAETPV